MGVKKSRVSQGVWIALLFYVIFIAFLYVRVNHARQQTEEYSSARLCILPSNCREILPVNMIDHKFSKMSFTNYGSKGLPVQSGSFQRYVFVLSIDGSENRTVYVLPNVLASPEDFDLPNVYLPVKSDETLMSVDLLKDKTVDVETWQDKITLILIKPKPENHVQSTETVLPGETSLGHRSIAYEMILPTDENPILILGYAQNDFNGWTIGILSMAGFFMIAGGLVYMFTSSLTWIDSKWRQDD